MADIGTTLARELTRVNKLLNVPHPVGAIAALRTGAIQQLISNSEIAAAVGDPELMAAAIAAPQYVKD